MKSTVTTIWKKVFRILRQSTGLIFTTHLAYVALGTVIFTPLVGVLGRSLLHLSGQPTLSDFDIAYFLLTPLGMAALILLLALLITIIVFEQASLMAISAGVGHGLHITTISALYFTARRVKSIFLVAIRLVIRVLIIVLPFLIASGAIAWFLLTDYDINYYLTNKPPAFLVAAASIGLLLLTMFVILLRKLLSWSFVLPLLLFSDLSPARCFAESVNLTHGHKRLFITTLGTWMAASLLLSSAVLGIVELLGSKLAPLFFDSITWLVPVLGGLVALWSLGNLLVTALTAAVFASLLLALYEHSGVAISTVGLTGRELGRQRRMTAPRFALFLIGCTAVAVLVGVWLLNGIQAVDNVSVIAHRGASGKAPENTIAAVRQAIKDGTDWVEIDVQETIDGEIVVIHDSDFMKLAGVDMKVRNGSLKELKEIDIGTWFNPEFSTERIPTLSDVLEEVRGKARLLIELKYYGYDRQLEQRVVDIVEQAGMVDDVAIMSLKHEGIKKFRALRPDWRTGLLVTKAFGNLSNLDVDFLAVNTALATSGFIRRTQSAGKQVYVWTVNDQTSMSRMMSLGVDGIITDEPEMARTVLTERLDLNSVERLLIHAAVVLGRPVPQRTYRDQSP